jgi:RNA polymerase sigma factor (sigma-70 family)
MTEHDALENNPHVSRQALAQLHEQLYGWSLSRCGYDPTTAEDLMQQAYVEILSGRARFDEKSTLKTFLFAVVQMLARGRFRKLASTLRLVENAAVHSEVLMTEAPNIDAARSHIVWQAVQALPARQRDITELVFCREMTIEEAAQVMGVSTGTGRTHYDRAKKTLAISLANLRPEIHELSDRYA